MTTAPTTPALADDSQRGSHSVQRLVREFVDARNADCMEVMAEYPDGHFDLAIVDPPYRDENSPTEWMKGHGSMRTIAGRPSLEYWQELRRVSREQIVWGANNFSMEFKGFVTWDKKIRGSDRYSWVEIAAISEGLGTVSSLVDVGIESDRIHPTQKPVKLYSWLLAKYAKLGQRILDTHMGSGSSGIACHYARCPLVACEIDPDYFRAACDRIERETAQADWYLPNAQGDSQSPAKNL